MGGERVIIHVDMDAFFASVEQRDKSELRGRPVVVGADPKGGKGRGVVSTASYEARAYGIRSAQPISQAYRLCPHAAFLAVDGARYSEESERIREILLQFTPQIQFAGIDEAYLDVTDSLRLFGGKRAIAESIRRRIEEERGLTASLGVAPNKLVAKIASDLKKPRGLVIVEPDGVDAFLRPLDVRRLPGVGPKMEEALHAVNVKTVGDLADMSPGVLLRRFGQWGEFLWHEAHGRDESPVEETDEVKSIGHEHTFEEDTDDRDRILRTLMDLCESTARRMRQAEMRGRTVTTKVRFESFKTVTRQQTLREPVTEAGQIYAAAVENLAGARIRRRKVRLIGVQVSGFGEDDHARAMQQVPLFGPPAAPEDMRLRIARAEDAVKDRFGNDAIRRGSSLENRTTQGGEPEGEPKTAGPERRRGRAGPRRSR